VTLKFEHSPLRVAFQEYLQNLKEIEERVKRLEEEIHFQGTEGVHAPMIQVLQSLRGVAMITAASLVAEIGSFKRFKSPKQLMSYTGLVPSETSSGEIRRQGKITKTGNGHARRLLIEASWSYRYQPAVRGELEKRLEGQKGSVQTISWKAQQRLHKKYYRLLARGKSSRTAITAVARELAGFVWAVAQEADEPSAKKLG
jgi:transposase